MYFYGIGPFNISGVVKDQVALWVSSDRIPYYMQELTGERLRDLMRALGDLGKTGLSILGNEPFSLENREDLFEICQMAKWKYPKKDVWVWTRYKWDQIKTVAAIDYIDVLVEGFLSGKHRIIDVKKSLAAGHAICLEGDWDDSGKDI